MQKGIGQIYILVGILIALIIAGGAYYLGRSNISKPKACTLEAKICPDGSSVGRVGPNCEFAPCPSPSADETANWKTYTNAQYKFSFKYPLDINLKIKDNVDRFTLILEDSKASFILDVQTANNFQYQNPQKSVNINNIIWNAFYSGGSCTSSDGGVAVCPQIIPYYQTTKNNFVYSFTFGLYEEKLANILKTFKFLQ